MVIEISGFEVAEISTSVFRCEMSLSTRQPNSLAGVSIRTRMVEGSILVGTKQKVHTLPAPTNLIRPAVCSYLIGIDRALSALACECRSSRLFSIISKRPSAPTTTRTTKALGFGQPLAGAGSLSRGVIEPSAARIGSDLTGDISQAPGRRYTRNQLQCRRDVKEESRL